MGTDALVVAVLGPGRLGETHLAALARLRERGLDVGGRYIVSAGKHVFSEKPLTIELDQAVHRPGPLRDPELEVARMKLVLALAGL